MSTKFAPPRPTYPNYDPLFRQVASLPYWDCRLYLARQIGPEKYPRFRYKYKALASDPGEDRAKQLRDTLVESLLWLSSPRALNDPFDMTAKVIFEPKSQEQLRERFKQSIAKLPGMTWKQRQEMLDRTMARTPADLLASAKRAMPDNLDSNGVLCFASDPRSLLMWSHYGDHHTGICLQFENARDPETMCQAVRVQYVADYPVVNWAEDLDKQIMKPLLNKFKKWKYEGEWRIIWPEGARTYLRFKPGALVGLIFGYRADDKAIQIVRAMLEERAARGHPPVKVYRAQLHESRYKLVLRRIESDSMK